MFYEKVKQDQGTAGMVHIIPDTVVKRRPVSDGGKAPLEERGEISRAEWTGE